MKSDNYKLVYSSEAEVACPTCRKTPRKCRCTDSPSAPLDREKPITLRCQRRGRRGKSVTLIEHMPLPVAELKVLSQELKIACGTGGSVRGTTIEIQGDQRNTLLELLSQRGYRVTIT